MFELARISPGEGWGGPQKRMLRARGSKGEWLLSGRAKVEVLSVGAFCVTGKVEGCGGILGFH